MTLRSRLGTIRARRRAPRVIGDFLGSTPLERRMVVLGGHWTEEPGFLLLAETDLDITRPLPFPDGSLAAIYTEHVLEHVDLPAGVGFLREARRVLTRGGTLRTVTPGIERMVQSAREDRWPPETIQRLSDLESMHDGTLRGLGLNGVEADPACFFLNSLFYDFGHRFIWSASLLADVLDAVGFHDVEVLGVGEGPHPELCLERRSRNGPLAENQQQNRRDPVLDLESVVVEGRA